MNNSVEYMSLQQQVKNTGIYLISPILNTILPLVSLPIILRYLSPEEYGTYVLSRAFAGVVIGLCHLSLLQVFERNYFFYTNEKEKVQLLFTIVSFVTLIMLIVGILIYFIKDYLAAWVVQNKIYGSVLFFTYFGWACHTTNIYFLSFLKNMGEAKMNIRIISVASIIGVILNIYFVSILKVGPLGLALGLFISNFLTIVLVIIYFLYQYEFQINLSLLISSLKLSIPLVPTRLMASFGSVFDKYIISVLTSLGEVGIYSISQRISNVAFQFMTAIHKVYGPIVYTKMFSRNKIDGDSEIAKYLTPFAYFSVSFALFISLFSEEILYIIAPPEYLMGLSVINILCIAMAIGFFAKQPQIMYAGKTVIQSVLSFVNFLCKIIFLYLGINYFGMVGAAVGILSVTIIYDTLLVWQGQKYYRIEYEWLKLSFIYGLLIFMSISLIFFRIWDLAYYNRLIIKLVYIFIFSGLGVYLNILKWENLLLIIKNEENN